MTLLNFQNHSRYNLSDKLPLADLLKHALDDPLSRYDPKLHLPKTDLILHYLKTLDAQSEMLDDYFSLKIEDGYLLSMPKINHNLPPYIEGLPMLMLRLASDVDYTLETKCFMQICELLGQYYARFIPTFFSMKDDSDIEDSTDEM